jgi:hypothetical protein
MTPLLDAFPLWAAIVPLAAYLLLLGVAHALRRPVAVSGTCDGLLLGAAVSGFVLVGPLALLGPAMGGTGWNAVLLVMLAGLFAALCMLVSRPRLVIYNITVDQVRPLVADVVASLDPAARWAGSTAALPTRRFEVRIDGHGPTRCVTLVSAGDRPAVDGWGEFCGRLRRGLHRVRVRSSPWAPVFFGLGGGALAVAIWCAVAPSSLPAAAAASSPPSSPQPGASDAGPRRSDGA